MWEKNNQSLHSRRDKGIPSPCPWLRHPRLGIPSRGLQIMDTRMGFPCPFRSVVIDSIILRLHCTSCGEWDKDNMCKAICPMFFEGDIKIEPPPLLPLIISDIFLVTYQCFQLPVFPSPCRTSPFCRRWFYVHWMLLHKSLESCEKNWLLLNVSSENIWHRNQWLHFLPYPPVDERAGPWNTAMNAACVLNITTALLYRSCDFYCFPLFSRPSVSFGAINFMISPPIHTALPIYVAFSEIYLSIT